MYKTSSILTKFYLAKVPKQVFSTEKICTGSYFFFRKSMGRIFLSHIGGTRLVLCARDLHRILFLFQKKYGENIFGPYWRNASGFMCQRFAQDLISFSEKVWVEYF